MMLQNGAILLLLWLSNIPLFLKSMGRKESDVTLVTEQEILIMAILTIVRR